MAIKKSNKEATENKQPGVPEIPQIKILKVKDFSKEGEPGCCIAFDMLCNGVTIYGCYYRESVKDGKEWSMVTFPSKKADNGKYYNHCWIKLSDDDVEAIGKTIESML